MTCGLQNMCQYVCPSSPLPLCEMAMLKITSRHICSYSKRAAEMGGRRALQQLTVAYKVLFAVHLFHGQRFRHATTAYFPPADVNSFCLSASVRGPRMQLCVRRWKFWNCVILNTMTYACLSQEKGSDISKKKSLNCLTYIWADRGEPGVEPMETFICSPCCLLHEFTVISSCRFDGFNWARLLIKKNVSGEVFDYK